MLFAIEFRQFEGFAIVVGLQDWWRKVIRFELEF